LGRSLISATVSDQWPFFDGQTVDSLILIELVAQTAGVTNGWVRIKQRGKDSEKKAGWSASNNPVFFGFQILDFGFKVFCPFNKKG
jgi:hypothetical protein